LGGLDRGAEMRSAEGVEGVRNGRRYPPPRPTRESGERRKRFYCFLSVSERLSLQFH